jgi:ABC-2 type transport system ATP-binding protein
VPSADFAGIAGVSDLRIDGSLLSCRLEGHADALVKAAGRHRVVTLSVKEADLEELFFHYYSEGGEAGNAG